MNNNRTLEEAKIDLELLDACGQGDIEQIQYLLTSPDLLINASIHDLSRMGSEAPIVACENDKIDTLKYLYFSPTLKYHACFNVFNNKKQNLPTVAFFESKSETIIELLTNNQFKNKFDLTHLDIDNLNILQHASLHNEIDIAKILILELNMNCDKYTRDWLQGNNPQNQSYVEILELIEKRDLYQKIDADLNISKIPSMKMKI